MCRYSMYWIPSLYLLTYSPTYLLIYLLIYVFTYLLTPWSRALLEKQTGFLLVKEFPAICGIRKFITAFTSARHLSLSWASLIQSIPAHPTSCSVTVPYDEILIRNTGFFSVSKIILIVSEIITWQLQRIFTNISFSGTIYFRNEGRHCMWATCFVFVGFGSFLQHILRCFPFLIYLLCVVRCVIVHVFYY